MYIHLQCKNTFTHVVLFTVCIYVLCATYFMYVRCSMYMCVCVYIYIYMYIYFFKALRSHKCAELPEYLTFLPTPRNKRGLKKHGEQLLAWFELSGLVSLLLWFASLYRNPQFIPGGSDVFLRCQPSSPHSGPGSVPWGWQERAHSKRHRASVKQADCCYSKR